MHTYSEAYSLKSLVQLQLSISKTYTQPNKSKRATCFIILRQSMNTPEGNTDKCINSVLNYNCIMSIYHVTVF